MPSTPPRLSVADPLNLEAEYTSEERALRDRVRAFAETELLPNIQSWWDSETIPRDLILEYGKLGILSLMHRGEDAHHTIAYGLVNAELEAVDAGLRTLFSVQCGLAMTAIHQFGTPEQRDRYLPAMRSGEILGAFALTEPESGSDPGSLTTTAKRDGSDWILNGHKRWNTNCSIADIVITWAKTEAGIQGFIIPTDTPGLTRTPVMGKYSLRAAAATEFTMDNVRVPADAILPGVVGLKGPLACLSEARYGIIWSVTGSMRTCLQTALDHATSRIQFGKPIGAFQLTQAKLADMLLKYSHAQLLALQIGRLKQRGELTTEQVSMGKLANVKAAIEVAHTARGILGGNGITDAYPVMRHMANLESILTYEGTAEVHTLVIGQALTGLSAFR
ncbi:MAG TPA: acyl-CoA dehydrogenase family protein [Thermomicrobiales bacterium]|nr:acyl-CoA dehydrogenase family protein [Thermomicrobiales bacterium]